MKRISSSSTLFLKVFLPVFWLVFFGSLTLGLFLKNDNEFEFGFMGYLKWFFIFFLVLFGIIIYNSIFQLKRIDADSEYIYVSNYLKTIRIRYSQIEKLSSKSLGFRLLGKLDLRNRGFFGTKIYFICEEDRYKVLHELILSTPVS
ncbi:MAG: hypothetical protein ABIO44_11845 [Saprospiraceae bacterium]